MGRGTFPEVMATNCSISESNDDENLHNATVFKTIIHIIWNPVKDSRYWNIKTKSEKNGDSMMRTYTIPLST